MPQIKICFIAFLVLFYLLHSPAAVQAYNLGPYLNINGFLSQGYINSTGNNVFGDSKGGSFQLNEFALTVNSTPTEKLRLSLQLLSRDLGTEGDNELRIDWAMADYRFQDSFGVRLGKIKLPIGLYNQYRDSDFVRPMTFLPQSIYDQNKRNLLVGAWGGNIYGNIALGAVGDIDYQAYYGKVDFYNDSGQAVGIKNLAADIANRSGLGTISGFDAENEYVAGGSLIYYPPLENLRLGMSYFTGETDFTFIAGDTPGFASGHNKNMVVFSAEYTGHGWSLASEYIEFTGDRKVLGRDIPDGRSQGGYLQFCYMLREKISISFLYDLFYADKNDRDGDKLVAQGKPDFLAWRKDLGTAIRWDINDRWTVRAEYHNIDGASLLLPIYNPTGVERYWSYYVLKTSFNF